MSPEGKIYIQHSPVPTFLMATNQAVHKPFSNNMFFYCIRHSFCRSVPPPSRHEKLPQGEQRGRALAELEDVLFAVDDAQRAGGRELANVPAVEPARLIQHLRRLAGLL